MYRKSLSYLKILVCAAFMMVTVSVVSPSAEAAVYTGSGDGMILIDGIPASSWDDIGLVYPNTIITIEDLRDVGEAEGFTFSAYTDYMLTLYNFSGDCYWDDSLDGGSVRLTGSIYKYVWLSSDFLASLLGFDSRSWFLVDPDLGTDVFVNVIYSNFAITDYPYSNDLNDIVSLDGYQYIWWDGFTDSLPVLNDYLYSVAPPIDSPSSAFSVTNISNFDYLAPTADRVFKNDLSVDGDNWFLGSAGSDDTKPYSCLSDFSSDAFYLSRYTSLPFSKYVTFFVAYVPGTGSPVVDFSNTELFISNPEYDFQSASFDVSWSGLPEIPYPENIQYYLTAKLNDGSSATHPFTYIGSSSDPPSGDVPVSFTFDDLQPSTEYSATVELRYAFGGNTSFDSTVSSGVTATVSFTTLSDGSISEGDKAIIDAIQNTNQQHEQWIDSEMGSAVGDLNEDVAAAEQQINDLNNQEEAFKDDAFARFQEVSASFSGFDGTVGSGIGLAGTLFSRFFNCLGDYAIIYTFPLILGLAMVIIGRLGRSSFSLEGKDSEKGGE